MLPAAQVNPPLRLLLVYDSEPAYDLLLALLSRDQQPVRTRSVEDEMGMRAVFRDNSVDVAVTAHNLTHFDSLVALAVAKSHAPDLPVPVVSADMSEELTAMILHAPGPTASSSRQRPRGTLAIFLERGMFRNDERMSYRRGSSAARHEGRSGDKINPGPGRGSGRSHGASR